MKNVLSWAAIWFSIVLVIFAMAFWSARPAAADRPTIPVTTFKLPWTGEDIGGLTRVVWEGTEYCFAYHHVYGGNTIISIPCPVK